MIDQTLTLADLDDVIPILLIAIVGAIVIIWLVFGNLRKAIETRAKEMTRREIAAYVAEGSISSDDARKLLGSSTAEAETQISNAVAWGTISPKKAEELIRAIREVDAQNPPAGRPAEA